MYLAAVRHTVQDYDRWKAVFDSFPPTAGGAKLARVNRDVAEPNTITVISGFESLAELQAFMGNPDLKAKMLEAGVVGEPRVEIVQEVEAI